MKIFFLLLLIASCSTRQSGDELEPFSKEKVCSQESLNYLQKKKKEVAVTNHSYSDEEISERLFNIEPLIRICYEQDLARSNHFNTFNLCMVTGFNSKGDQEFFEFSTREVEMSNELVKCLHRIKKSPHLKGLHEISILQPFRLFPKLH